MKRHFWAICGIAGLGCLLLATLAVGGAALLQPGVAGQARAESPLAQTYIVMNRYASDALPSWGAVSRALADACFAEAWPAIEANPALGLDLLFAQSHGVLSALVQLAYWGAPILLLLCVILFFTRPREVHLIGS